MERRKCIIVISLILLMIIQCIVPFGGIVNAATNVKITLSKELYNAVKRNLISQNIGMQYSDDTNTITITDTDLQKVTYMDLSNSSIDDLTGLSSFAYLTNLNLTANELTVDSNLGELDSLPLEKLNLSSNKLESVSSITTFDNIAETDITNQEVNLKEIITVDTSEESDQSHTYVISLPQILLEDTGVLDADWLDVEIGEGDNCSVDWSTVNGTSLRLNVASGSGDSYAALKGSIKLTVNVTDSASKLANTKMTLYYIVIDSDETGIIFEDENLYNAIKSQLTAKQMENEELESYGEDSETTLYSRCYDDALILVIDTDTLINKIPSLVLNDKRVTDLTGLEEFVGLDTELNLSYNYIESIGKIIELDENKEAKETELQQEYSKYLSNLSSYRSSLKTALEEYNALKETLEKLESDENSSETEIATAEQNLANKATSISTNRNLISATLEKLYEVYENEYLITSLLTPETYVLTSEDINGFNKETAQSNANAIMDKISNLEQADALSDWEIEILVNAFEISTTTSVDGESVDIENPITAYFETLKESSDLYSVSFYKEFLNEIKVIDAIVVAGNYCLNENLYGEESTCLLSTAFDELIADLSAQGYDTTYAENAKTTYTTYTSGCMCDLADSKDEAEEIISGKYANASDLVSLFVRLPRLKNLNMTDNSVESIDGLEALAELETLNMYKNLLDDVTAVDWSTFTNMKNLNLGFNQLSDVNCLEVLTKLETLDLTRNLIAGSFNFSLVGMSNLQSADFSYNQISNIEYFTNQFKFLAKSKGMSVEEYVLSEYCPDVKFQYQTLSIRTTVVQDGSFITVDLPSIFEQAESIDYSRTSFGIDSLLGTVEADGSTVKLYTPSVGERNATVTIDGYNGTGYSTDGLAYGTVCEIAYTVVENPQDPTDPEDPTDPTDPEDPTDPTDPEDPTDPTDPEDPTDPTDPEDPVDDVEIEYGYTVSDGYVYVSNPEISLSTFANNLVTSEGFTINVVNSEAAIGDYLGTGAVVSIDTAEGKEVVILEVVVLGDVNGDGEVDALDSGIVKNVINDTTTLVGVYADSADVNNDGDIDSLDALLILQYRADKITSF